ncbi:MAG: site-specific integrase [Gemmataceae bacterium]|nr:site-specific integrase [Gemmataceae bacterium]
MRKTGRPWYRKGNDSWYVWHAGRQVQLAKGRGSKAEAFARFAELLTSPVPQPEAMRYTVADLVREFLADAGGRVKRSTFVAYRSTVKPFVATFGTREPKDLTQAQVEQWAKRGKGAVATQRYALIVVSTIYSWAEKTGRLTANPLKGMKKPPAKSRGPEVLIDSELHDRLLEAVSPEFRDFLRAVRGTGARPGEVARIEANDVQWDGACWVLTEHKTARTGRLRTIYLPDDIVSLCRDLAAKHPTGPLFRNTRGEPWKRTGWKQAMERAQRKLGLAAGR